MLVDDYTATKNPNINKFSGHPIIPLKIKDHNIALPVLTDRIKNNNLRNYERLFISNIINNKKIKSKYHDFFRFYHPWLSNLCKNEEINSFLSYCYNITKVTPPPVKIRKIKINDIKNSNKNNYNNVINSYTFNKTNNNPQKNYRLSNVINRGKYNYSSVGTNTIICDNNNNRTHDQKLLSMENLDNSKAKFKYFHPIKDKISNKSFRNSYLTLKKKGIKKISTLSNGNFVYMLEKKNNKASSVNNSVSNIKSDELLKYHINNNYSTMRGEYKTIKIKKVTNKIKYIDRRIFRDTFRIESKFNS